MKLTAEQIELNWKTLIRLIEDTFDSKRKEKLLEMYNDFQDRMMIAPASGQEHFHNCHPGGYVQHILNIVHYSKEFYKLWKDNGAYVDDYTEEELIFAAIHHDLGKVGDLEQDHYIPNPSEWHRKNQGKIYTNNPNLKFMTPPDRGIWILNQYGITMTENEFIGIKLTDGMYDDGNVQYLKSYAPEKKLKSNMQHILHQADMTTTRIEYEQWLHAGEEQVVVNTKVPKTKKEQETVDNMKAKFDELFA
jgi:hypothetical protein